MFDDIVPYIDFIDNRPQNSSDAKRVIFRCSGDPKQVIQWCRRNFGQRGDGWDFSGGKNVDIMIWSSKLITMYELWQN